MIECKYLSRFFARLSIEVPKWSPASEVLFPPRTSTSVLVVQRVERVLVSVLHTYLHLAGNYTCLTSNTVLLISIDSILLVLFQHHVGLCDS